MDLTKRKQELELQLQAAQREVQRLQAGILRTQGALALIEEIEKAEAEPAKE